MSPIKFFSFDKNVNIFSPKEQMLFIFCLQLVLKILRSRDADPRVAHILATAYKVT